jgi:threonine dehydratase
VVACGGGGLFAGLCAAFDGVATVQPVEPRLCPALFDALRAGIRVPTRVGGVAADSLGAPMIGELGYEAAVETEVGSVLVDEDAILAARRFLWSRLRVLAEPGACVALAAVLAGAVDVSPGQTVAVVVSGGNDDSLPA